MKHGQTEAFIRGRRHQCTRVLIQGLKISVRYMAQEMHALGDLPVACHLTQRVLSARITLSSHNQVIARGQLAQGPDDTLDLASRQETPNKQEEGALHDDFLHIGMDAFSRPAPLPRPRRDHDHLVWR